MQTFVSVRALSSDSANLSKTFGRIYVILFYCAGERELRYLLPLSLVRVGRVFKLLKDGGVCVCVCVCVIILIQDLRRCYILCIL